MTVFAQVKNVDIRRRSRVVIGDADAHLMEDPGWLARYADDNTRRELAPLPLWVQKETQETHELTVDEVEDGFDVMERKEWEALGASRSEGRSLALDHLGLSRQLIFPTFSIGQFLLHDDLDVVYGGAEAMNRGIADFCADDPRMLPTGFVPLHDPVRAVQALKKALSDGACAVQLPVRVLSEVSPTHPRFREFWQVLEQSDRPFVVHAGGFDPAYDKRYNQFETEETLEARRDTTHMEFMTLNYSGMMLLSALVLDGVLDTFPGLRGACLELGATWVPSWLRQLDLAQTLFGGAQHDLDQLSAPPSDIVRRQLRFTPLMGEPLSWIIEQSRANLLMFSTDYPHSEGGQVPFELAERALSGMSEEDLDLFFYENFRFVIDGAQKAS